MIDLRHRENKLAQIAKAMTFRDAVKNLWARSPLIFYRYKGKISRFHECDRVGIVCEPLEWEAARDSAGEKFPLIFSWDFFSDFKTLYAQVPQPRLMMHKNNFNCDFADMSGNTENIYLSFVGVRSQNVLYSFSIKDSADVLQSVSVSDASSIIYGSNRIVNSHKVFFSSGIVTSSDIWFSSDLTSCKFCWNCHNMEYASYCIDNIAYTPEVYTQKIAMIRQKMLPEDYHNTTIGHLCIGSTDCTGCDRCIKCSHLENSLNAYQISEGKNVFFCSSTLWSKGMYNTYLTGNASEVYTIMHSGGEIEYAYICLAANNCSHVYYSVMLQSCSYCLGCIALKNQSFCIFNKQYSKEEWYEKVNEIFSKMEQEWTFWQFFPATMNPFYFNDTAAYLIDPSFSKEEVMKEWYLRRDEEIKVDIPEWAEVLEAKDFWAYQRYDADGKWQINPEIMKKVIKDNKWDYYKIVKMEYDFLMKYWLPLPQLHRLERIKLWFKFK